VQGGYTTREPISPAALLALVAGPDCGATCLFLGTVRDGPEDGGVTGIEYSAYEAMAGAELDRIIAETRRQWPAARLALRHRLGLVPTEEASIGIAAAAPHRADAFAACRYVIEEVKKRLPIWKKELRADGSVLWVDPQGRPAVVGPE
jgi:molybdopterin synthase catalytic subunit